MGSLMRSTDWSKTALGTQKNWSPALRMMADFLLANRFPQLLWWGPEFCSLYNDAYIPILGAKHPAALGRPVSEVWKEIWHILKPLIETPFQGGPATWMEDIPLEINRRGFFEETHFTIAYSPVPDDTVPSGIGGVLATVHEITDKVIGERRVHALRELGARSAEPRSDEEACAIVGTTLSSFAKDVPFLLLYLLNEKQLAAKLACSLGVDSNDRACPAAIQLNAPSDQVWPLSIVQATEQIHLVDNLKSKFDVPPQGPWSDTPNMAAVVPIRSNLQHRLAGFMVAGLSSRISFDEKYRDFLDLMATQIATMVANARAYEQERKRAEALAELDRAKTVFFSNISHELRTPLTLLLGPTESALASKDGALRGADLEMVHRNELRLLKLVNTLLDFSRIEAGRVQAAYEATDLCRLTTDIASAFRSAMEKVGLKFTVRCEKLGEPLYVDREMWEKIVLNLLSNAFKFTFSGEVALTLRDAGNMVELSVRDTGVGIPGAELPRVFERFHRVESTRARTHEGTGIGLALVEELVRLHGGSVSVDSVVGRGSTFFVTIPKGADHLPAEQIGARRTLPSTALNGDVYVEEATHWLPGDGVCSPVLPEKRPTQNRQKILVVDDNADMRAYVTHLLAEVYDVHTAPDGAEAIEAARRLRPALILTDAMMPGLDGFGLLRAIRNHPELRDTPVIMLSARAGEEARVEGLDAGADDYLVKPFTAREMLARVAAHLRFAQLRDEAARRESRLQTDKAEAQHALSESERRFRALATASTQSIYRMSPDWKEMRQLRGSGFLADSEEPNPKWMEEYIFAEDQARVQAAIDAVIRTGGIFELEHRIRRADGSEGWVLSRAVPIRDEQGQVTEWFGAATNITERVFTRRQLEEKQAQLEKSLVAARHLAAIVESSDAAIASKNLQGVVTSWNRRAEQLFGYTAVEMIGQSIKRIIPPELENDEDRILATIARGERIEHFETTRLHKDGQRIDVALTISPIRDEAGRIVGASKIVRDITDQKRAEQLLRTTDRLASVGKLAATVAHEINNPLEAITNLLYLARYSNDVEQTRSFISQADEELKRVALLTRQTLGFYRESNGSSTMRLGAVIQSVLDLFAPKLRNKRVRLQIEIRQDPEIHGIESEIRRLIANLANNSIDAVGEEGTIRIRLSTAHGPASGGEPGVRFTIADTGGGILPKYRVRVFEPFFTTKKDVGTGLGLWISKAIVDSHNGTIAVKSSVRPGRTGTVFSIFLPVQHEAAGA